MADFFLELWNTGGIVGIAALVLAIMAYLQYLMSKMKDENQKMIRDFAASEAEERKELQSRLDSTEQAFDGERKSWEAERKTFLAERDRLIKELERSTTSEAEMGKKIKELTGDIEKLRIRINDMDAERKADKLEKEQILRDAKLTQKELATATKEKKKLQDERSLLERMLSENKDSLNDLRERVSRLEKVVELKDHELSKAYGTIATLTSSLNKLTDETQEIPPFDAIENAGNDDEVVTPVLNMELNIEEAENTTIVEPNLVTPVESSTDNKSENEDNEPKKGAA